MNIDPSLYLQNKPPERKTGGDGTLDKDAFIKILLTQLANQDPSNPMQDREFIAQMAQFSALEQMTNLNETMQKFIKTEEKSQLVSFSQMVGKEIVWYRQIDMGEGQPPLELGGKGIVKTVEMLASGGILFLLEDGTEVLERDILRIQEQPSYSNPRDQMITEASMLIGKTVTWKEVDPDTEEGVMMEAIVQSVSFKDGVATYHLDNDKSIKGSDIIKVANS